MTGDPTTSLPEDDEPDFAQFFYEMGEEDSPPAGASLIETVLDCDYASIKIDWGSLVAQLPQNYPIPTCQKCGTPLECMPGGGCLADFECPKCCPEGFRPLGMTLEEWHNLNRVLDTIELAERIDVEDGMIGR